MSRSYDSDDEYAAFMSGDVGTAYDAPLSSGDLFTVDDLPTAPRHKARATTAPVAPHHDDDDDLPAAMRPEAFGIDPEWYKGTNGEAPRPVQLPSAEAEAARAASEGAARTRFEPTLGSSGWSAENSRSVADALATYDYESDEDDVYDSDLETYNEGNPPLRPMRIRHYDAACAPTAADAKIASDRTTHAQRTRVRMSAIYDKDGPKLLSFIAGSVAKPERAPPMCPVGVVALPTLPAMRRETSLPAAPALGRAESLELNVGAVAIPQYLELVEAIEPPTVGPEPSPSPEPVSSPEPVAEPDEAARQAAEDEAEATRKAAEEEARLAAVREGVTARLLAKAAAERARRDAKRAEKEADAARVAAEAEAARKRAAAAARAAKRGAKATAPKPVAPPVPKPEVKIVVGSASYSVPQREQLLQAYAPGVLHTLVCKLVIQGHNELASCYTNAEHRVAMPPIVTDGINVASPTQCNLIRSMPYPVSTCKEGMACEWYNRRTYELAGLPVPSRYKFSRTCHFLHIGSSNIIRDGVEFVQCCVIGCTESDDMHYTPRNDIPMRVVHITPSTEECDYHAGTFCPNMLGKGCSRKHGMAGTAMMSAIIRGILYHHIKDPEEWASRNYRYLNGVVKDVCRMKIPNGSGTFRDRFTRIPGLWPRDMFKKYDTPAPRQSEFARPAMKYAGPAPVVYSNTDPNAAPQKNVAAHGHGKRAPRKH